MPPQLVVSAPDPNPTRFRDVQVEENNIYEVNSCGIATRSGWTDLNADTLWPNVVVRNNVIDRPGGSGMIIRNTTGALIEGNIVSNANERSGQAGVGIYPFNAVGTVLQYNEAYGTYTPFAHDGQGFDIDYEQTGTIFQYNYSHDNLGGFIVSTANGAYGYTSTNSIARYNVSQNDVARIFRFSGGSQGIQMYNNTIYIGTSFTGNIFSVSNWGGLYPINSRLSNNIIYNESTDTQVSYDFGPATGVAGTGRIDGFVFDSCVFYNTDHTPLNEPTTGDIRYTVLNKITSDPQLVAVNSGANGLETVDGYKLKASSPLIGAGAIITTTDAATMPLPTQDYWGNPVSSTVAPSIGAYDGQGVGTSTLYFAPVGDTYSRDGGSATSNFGTQTSLEAKGDDGTGYNRRSYLKFDLSSLAPGSVTSAKLRIYCTTTQDGAAVATALYGTTDGWTETGLTWNSQPALGSSLSSLSVTAGYCDFDVTTFIQQETASTGDKVVSLVLTANGAKLAQFNSRENAVNPPRLMVAGTVSAAAVADAYIRGGTNSSTNYGTAADLAVKDDITNDFSRRSYLRFNLPIGLVGVNSAKLRVYGNSSSKPVKVRVFRVDSNTWTETNTGGVTWDNAPAAGIPQTAAVVNTAAQYFEFDVSDYVQNRLASATSAVTFLLQATDNSQDLVEFNSREATSNPPQLVLK